MHFTCHETRLHYWRAINRAQLDGFHALAASLLRLYRERFPSP